jgi:helix-turn-helix protein
MNHFWFSGTSRMEVSRDLTARQLSGLDDGAVEQVRVRILPDGRMSREDAARYLGHKPKTLAMWKLSGKGPQWVKVGGRIFYFRSDLDSFINGGEDT